MSGTAEPPMPVTALGPSTKPRPAITLRSAEFRKARETSWRDLDEIVTRIEKKGIRAASAEDMQRLPLLYRGALSSLSVARGIALDRNLLRYLEDLSLRAYLVVYGPRTGVLESLGAFLRRGFPRAVRDARWHVLLAFLAIAVGTAAGYLLVIGDEDWFTGLAGGIYGDNRGATSTAAELRDHEIFAPWQGFVHSFVVFANSLFRHNAVVGLLMFGLGLAAGVPTLLLLVYQGLVFGAFAALHARRGLLVDFLAWISIHGVTEFAAIILCGAGGLMLADKMLFPGRLSRLDNLARHGRAAAQVAAGAVGLFFIAGLIEGGFRQLIDSTPTRFAFAAVTAVLWLIYVLSGRQPAGTADDDR